MKVRDTQAGALKNFLIYHLMAAQHFRVFIIYIEKVLKAA